MSIKKRMILVLTAVMVLSVAIGSFAIGTKLSFDGNLKRSFLSSDYILKSSSEKWSLFTVTLTEIRVAKTAQARPETSSGDTCGTRFSISTSKSTEYLPNETGKTTNEIHVRLYTNEYANDGTSASTSIYVEGTMTGNK